MAARILIVEHEALAGAALIGRRLAEHDVDVTVCGPATAVNVPTDVGEYDGIVVLGGSMGPTEDEIAPWLPDVRSLLRDAIAHATPLLAVCLGAQLLATALDGRVEPLSAPEVATTPIALTEAGVSDRLLGVVPSDAPTLHWHWLHVAQLPTDATVLATTEQTAVQAYRVGDHAWATQFHLEADERTATDWVQDMGAALPAAGIDPDLITRDWAAAAERAQSIWSPVIDRWIALAIRGTISD